MASLRGSIAKAILCILNMFFIVVSCSIVFYGFQIQVQHSNPNFEQTIPDWKTLSIAMILFGFILGIVSLFGFSAALCESPMLLNIYVYFLSLGTILSIFLTIMALLFSGQVIDISKKEYTKLMNTEQNTYNAFFIQYFQRTFYCCGIKEPKDWFNQTFGNVSLEQDTYPASCCQEKTDWKNSFKTCQNLASYDGCFSSNQLYRYKIYFRMALTIVIMFFALLLSLACCLERDRCLQLSQLVNLQYAAHLSSCRRNDYFNPNFRSHYNMVDPTGQPQPLPPSNPALSQIKSSILAPGINSQNLSNIM